MLPFIQVLASLLPPKKPEPVPYPETVDVAQYEESDIMDVRSRSFPASADFFDQDFQSQFGGDDEDEWEDEEEGAERDFEHMGAEPECRPQWFSGYLLSSVLAISNIHLRLEVVFNGHA